VSVTTRPVVVGASADVLGFQFANVVVTAVEARRKEGGPTQTHGRTHVRVASPTGGEVVMSSRWD